MDRQDDGPRHAAPDWVLVANAGRARCFARDPANQALKELHDFVHPASRLPGSSLGTDRGGQVRKSAASTQFAPHTDPHKKEQALFAAELAAWLEDAACQRQFPRLALIASAALLGELRAHLGSNTRHLLGASVALDLTQFDGAELERRVAQALQGMAEPPA